MGVGKDVHEGREYDGEEWAELPEFVGVLYPESPCIGLNKNKYHTIILIFWLHFCSLDDAL